MNVLGIETSCDETAAAVVRDGGQVLSSVVLSQTHLHRPYGGVVPEIASRSHVECLPSVIEESVRAAQVRWEDIDVVAVTYGPGLATSLLVGLAAAKALALRLGKPLCAINHLEAHIHSAFLEMDSRRWPESYPLLALVVSGGHTCLVRAAAPGRYTLLGQTIDDAAGEAFDKGANLLGIGYPGGPAIEKAAQGGDPNSIAFPRGRQRSGRTRLPDLDTAFCFSFSGLKTALLYHLRNRPLAPDRSGLASVAASYQEAIVDSLVERSEAALDGVVAFGVVGGVSLNRRLREKAKVLADRRGVRLLLAAPRYCADNAAMVAGLAAAGQGIRGEPALALDACPDLPIG